MVTNLEVDKLKGFIPLTKSYCDNIDAYPKYDNYDAIEVSRVKNIPKDYDGVMGVPITFLKAYNPKQFEIVGITKTWNNFASKIYPRQIQVSSNGRKSEVTKLNDGGVIKLEEPPEKGTYYLVDDEIFIQKYTRILIKNKKVVK